MSDAGYPAGAQFDPKAPFNQEDAIYCDDCGEEIDYELMECVEAPSCHPIYQARFWVLELKDFLSWEESQKFYSAGKNNPPPKPDYRNSKYR